MPATLPLFETTPATAPGPAPAADATPAPAPADWYKDAVIYQLHVKAFFDSNDDGLGDFRGLSERLDYIKDLGVNTIWLLPFYPSPLRDDGYDVADYTNVNAAYGARTDFHHFVREAHRRELRVVTELIVNHTSDQHPWFQAARRAPKGSSKRNWYVWSDDPKTYAGTRIIFTDTEKSNWAWDDLAKAFYWHRFFSHQPDLNFDNPQVRKAIFRVMRFWLDLGVDGFRLDAIPYLCEREGTNNENLPETHAVLKELRATLDAHYPGKLLLAEANQWPEDVREYFGEGDECHMAFHFPLMPRMYMAIAQEERHPITEIMGQTPDIPEPCQWAIFLRNHDELTLEMVTSKERDYMYQMYATDPRARVNVGIRRRLAPLLENDTGKIKLMTSLLLSMPGSPILYYGDEIGMGDNIYLGDRDGVRTPMQWRPERNAGFSRADPQRALPPADHGSDLRLRGRQRRGATARAGVAPQLERAACWPCARGSGRSAAADSRFSGRATARFSPICVNMATRSSCASPTSRARHSRSSSISRATRDECRWSSWDARRSRRSATCRICSRSQAMAFSGSGWPREARYRRGTRNACRATSCRCSCCSTAGRACFAIASSRGGSRCPRRSARSSSARRCPPSSPVAAGTRRRARRRARSRSSTTSNGRAATGVGSSRSLGSSVTKGEGDTYFLPLTLGWEDGDEERMRTLASLTIAKVRQQSQVGILADAFGDDAFCRALVARHRHRQASSRWRRAGCASDRRRRFAEIAGPAYDRAAGRRARRTEQQHDRRFRRAPVPQGVPPLAGRASIRRSRSAASLPMSRAFANSVPVAGSVEYVGDGRTHDRGRAAAGLCREPGRRLGVHAQSPRPGVRSSRRDSRSRRAPASNLHGGYLALIRTLGRRTAELHAALRDQDGRSRLRSRADRGRGCRGVDAARRMPRRPRHSTGWRRSAKRSRSGAPARRTGCSRGARRSLARIETHGRDRVTAAKTRLHGDYHLGQVLIVQNDFMIADFEGEPARTLAERAAEAIAAEGRRGHAALVRLRDARGAATWVPSDPEAHAQLERAGRRMAGAGARGVPRRLRRNRAGARVSRCHAGDGSGLLELLLLEKALYELRYELEQPPGLGAHPAARPDGHTGSGPVARSARIAGQASIGGRDGQHGDAARADPGVAAPDRRVPAPGAARARRSCSPAGCSRRPSASRSSGRCARSISTSSPKRPASTSSCSRAAASSTRRRCSASCPTGS